ncbi:hypothetical protein [Sphaerochaeta sp.]|uniref:hypothetical protein n=1 Tax=Sphaerochaeta sp. TaxID=1972642 RepID=UPI002FCC201D
MKKTIAILLVLVIGMVGVFAADTITVTNAKLEFKTEVTGVNLMGLSSSATAPAGNSWTIGDLDYTGTPVNTASVTPIAYLHTKTNHRSGIEVTMLAGALTSSAADPTGAITNASVNLAYKVSTLGPDGSATVTSEATSEGAANNATTIISTGAITGMTVTSRNISVEIPTYADALAGTYTGTITFAYTAN